MSSENPGCRTSSNRVVENRQAGFCGFSGVWRCDLFLSSMQIGLMPPALPFLAVAFCGAFARCEIVLTPPGGAVSGATKTWRQRPKRQLIRNRSNTK